MRATTAVTTLMRLGLVAAAAACSGNPGPAATTPQPAPRPAAAPPAPTPASTPAPTPAPIAAAAATPSASAIDMTGSWSGTVDVQGQTLGLDMNLARAANGSYNGDVAPQGQPSAPLRSLTLDGNHLVMVFSAPDGEATFDMMVTADRQAFSGNISYQGQTIPFTARKRP
ncbi:MAG: hypothetical protein ACHQU1_06310 [Gemmatimonadales bacterium]